MVRIKEMDMNVPFFSQLSQTLKPVTVIIQFNVPALNEEQFLKAWQSHGLCMKKFDGYLGEQLHKGVGGSVVYIHYSTWESVGQFAAAFGSQESQACVGAYPDEVTLAGQLLEKIAIEGVCKGQLEK